MVGPSIREARSFNVFKREGVTIVARVVMVAKYVMTMVVGTLLLALFVTGASAAQSQGLHWGFVKGQQYYFTQRAQDPREAEPSEVNLMYVCDDYPSIQDPLTGNSSPPRASFQAYLINGSPTDVGIGGSTIAVPIGNWSLLSDVFESYWVNTLSPQNATSSFQTVENNVEWGFTFEWLYLFPHSGVILQFSYSKQDGVLTQYSQGSGSSDKETVEFTLVRLPMAPHLQSILATGIAFCIVVMVIVVYARFRRH